MGAFWYLLTDLRTFGRTDYYELTPELFWASVIAVLLGAIIFPLIERTGKKKDKDKDGDEKGKEKK